MLATQLLGATWYITAVELDISCLSTSRAFVLISSLFYTNEYQMERQ